MVDLKHSGSTECAICRPQHMKRNGPNCSENYIHAPSYN